MYKRTQASVSLQIRKLENLIGTKLFKRSSSGLVLKPSGEQLVPYAREILRLNDQIDWRFNSKHTEGRVRLGIVEDFAPTPLADILKMFRDRNPKIAIDLIAEANKRLADMFEIDKRDAVVCDVSSLNCKPILLCSEDLLLVVRTDLAIPLDAPLPIIMFDQCCPWRGPTAAALSAGSISWNLAGQAPTLLAVVAAVHVGIAPMIARTIPADHATNPPESARVNIDLYVQLNAPGEAHHLVDFVAAQTELRRS